MREKKLDVTRWLLRVLAWDGLLPAGVALVASLIALVLPNNLGFHAMSFLLLTSFIVLPVSAFLIRYIAGRRHISRNNCSESTRERQFVVFVFGIFILALVEAWLIFLHLFPNGGPFFGNRDPHVLATFFTIYIISMVIAMYPGRQAEKGGLDNEVRQNGTPTAR